MTDFINSSSSIVKYTFVYENIKLVSSNIPGFGLWVLISNNAYRIWDSGMWTSFYVVDGGIFCGSSIFDDVLLYYSSAKVYCQKHNSNRNVDYIIMSLGNLYSRRAFFFIHGC